MQQAETAFAVGWRSLAAACGIAAAFVTAVVLPLVASGWIDVPAKSRDVTALQLEQQAMRMDLRELKILVLRVAADVQQIDKTPARRPARPLRSDRIQIGF